MKKLILGLLAIMIVNVTFGQQIKKLDYCNCEDKVDRISPTLNGPFERNCNDRLIEKGEFNNGLKNGEWITYSRKGALIRKMNYDNGLLSGKIELYYVNGKPKLTGEFEKGNKTGRWTYYTGKGKILAEGSYNSNKPIDIWTINNKKGKKLEVQYNFNSNKYLINNSTILHKDGDIIRNENTEEWYILKSPDLKNSSKTEPLGGYGFANFMFIELVEVPEIFWDTYLYNKYKVTFKITEENSVTVDCQLISSDLPESNIEITFLIVTNPTSKIKEIDHSDFQLKLLEFKINEALSLMPPWVYNDNSEVEVDLHYVINQNMHRKKK